jgi:hypothetical protein
MFVILCNPGEPLERLRDLAEHGAELRVSVAVLSYQKFDRLSKRFVPFRQFFKALVDGHLRP